MSHLPDTIDSERGLSDQIIDRAKHRIRARMTHDTYGLSFTVDQGRLILRGRVLSFYHKQLAQEAVANLEGVCLVVNEIEVVGSKK